MSILWYQQLLRTIASNQDLLLYISMWNAVNEVLQVKGLLASGKNRYIHEEQKATTKRGTITAYGFGCYYVVVAR